MVAKVKLDDLTIYIPIRVESDQRFENIMYVIMYINHYFDVPIHIIESSVEPALYELFNKGNNITVIYEKNDCSVFHKTRLINQLIKECKTKYASIYDADVLFHLATYKLTLDQLQAGYSFVYPYAGEFWDISRDIITADIETAKLSDYKIEMLNNSSWGGAVFFNVADFKQIGGLHEKFFGYGLEDMELFYRIVKIGYNYCRIQDECYHITHERGINSNVSNPFYKNSLREYKKIIDMSEKQLKKYIKKWNYFER